MKLFIHFFGAFYIQGVRNVSNILRGGTTHKTRKRSPIYTGPKTHTFSVLYTFVVAKNKCLTL